jgi:PD-(D/E)XK nuclease superfamily protein
LSTTTQTLTKPSFYKILPDGRFEFFLDASMMKDFSLCESYFYHKHVKNLRLKGLSTTKPFPMVIGSWWSSVMEVFYNALRDKKDFTPQDVQDTALTQWVLQGVDECADSDPDRYKAFGDSAGAVLMLLEYYNSQYLTDRQNWHIVGVEEGFGLKKEILLGETRSVVVYWIGKPDLVVIENNRLTPVDSKTVDTINKGIPTISLYKPSDQMAGYVFACQVLAKQLDIKMSVDRAVVNICARSRPSDNPRSGKKRPRFIRAYPNFSREELEEWRLRVIAKAERLAHCLKFHDWVWSETSCHSMYFRDCDYVKLHSATPSARDIILRADFEEGRPWVPYEI